MSCIIKRASVMSELKDDLSVLEQFASHVLQTAIKEKNLFSVGENAFKHSCHMSWVPDKSLHYVC